MNCVLKDLIAVSKDGEWGKGEAFDDSVEMLAIRGTDFEDARFCLTGGIPRRHIAKRHAERKLLQPWDVIIEAAGGTKNQITGRTVLLRPQIFARSELPFTCASFSRFIRFNTKLCDPAFMFWYLQHLYASGSMHAYHTQHTGVARFQWTTFSEREPLSLPPLPIQRRIAGILSAYDELIENSQRRIKILESMARALYREWFVHFRFPGHESVPRVASKLGEIPKGWVVSTVREVAGLVSRGPSLTYIDSGGVQVVNQRCIRNEEIEMQAIQYAAPLPEKKSHLYLKPRDVLINSMGIGTLGRVSRNLSVDEPTIIHNCITVVRSRAGEPTTAFLYYLLSACQDHFESLGVGATGQTSLRIETIEDVQFAFPPVALLTAFEQAVLPMWTQVGVLKRQIQNLRRTRDLLLPRLLSGEIALEA